MKIKLDENLPFELVAVLRAENHDVDTVQQELLTGASDPLVFQAAGNEGRLLITQDLDFSDLRKFAPGTHSGIMLVRLHRPGRRSLTARITQIFQTEKVEEWLGCFVVVGDQRLRVRKPTGG